MIYAKHFVKEKLEIYMEENVRKHYGGKRNVNVFEIPSVRNHTTLRKVSSRRYFQEFDYNQNDYIVRDRRNKSSASPSAKSFLSLKISA